MLADKNATWNVQVRHTLSAEPKEFYKVMMSFLVVVVGGGERQGDGSVELDAGEIGGCEYIYMFPRNNILCISPWILYGFLLGQWCDYLQSGPLRLLTLQPVVKL